LLADTKSEADRVRTSAQRQVDELNKQKESVAAHLAQISQLLGGQMPGIADALKPKPAPAVQAPAPKAVTSAPPAGNGAPAAAAPVTKVVAASAAPTRSASPDAPAGQHAAPGRPDSQPSAGGAGVAKQSANAKSSKADDEEWWTE
jgi:hypothetical protein